MKRMTPDQVAYLKQKVPAFIQAVEAASQPEGSRQVVQRLEQYRGDFTLLYLCLWHASDTGVDMLFQAKKRTKKALTTL